MVQGVIRNIVYFGAVTLYRVELAGGQILKVELTNAARHEERRLNMNDAVWAWWDGSDLVVLTQ